MDEQIWAEYLLAYNTYEEYNSGLLTIKAWSVSIGIAALLAAYTKPVSPSGRIGVIVAAFCAIPFWLTETFWKLFQRTSLERVLQIERCINDIPTSEDVCRAGNLASTWESSFRSSSLGFWWEGAFDLHVIFPHVALLTAGIVLAIWYPPRSSS